MTFVIVIVGYGKMAAECARIVAQSGCQDLTVIETKDTPFSTTKMVCSQLGVPYSLVTDTDALTATLKSITMSTMVLSINNDYIFPSDVLSLAHVRYVNFHGSLLPRYRGHGDVIPSWVIFNQELVHGVTWHVVHSRLDSGGIICQKSIAVSQLDTAISLMMRVITAGIDLFASQWATFWDKAEQPIETVLPLSRPFRKRELPNNGRFDRSWDFATAERFLRCMNTHPLNFLPPAKITLDNREYSVKMYRTLPEINGSTSFWLIQEEIGGEKVVRYVTQGGAIELKLGLG